ncbi:MAG: hypothetical protein JKY81_05630 [Colwellia sp.]|nr:hypothetical protein [Colwellia sp.]
MTIISNVASQVLTNGISISTSNVLTDQTPVITDAGIGETPSNISDWDHSLNYTCGNTALDFEVSYGAQSNISYVAISGHTAATPAQATIELYNDSTLVQTAVIKRNHNIMFTFPLRSFQDLKIRFVTLPNSHQTTVTFIAAGQHLTIKTGEQTGYKRAWLNRHTTQRTTTNLVVGPVAGTRKAKSLPMTLSFPNELATFAEDEWQTFIDFSFDQPFFIKEQSDKPESTYICSNPKHGINAHAQTRQLDAITVKFTAYNGL